MVGFQGEEEDESTRFRSCCLLALGGNIDSRVTDGVILHIHTLKLSEHILYVCVSMCVSCSHCTVQPLPGAGRSIPHTAGLRWWYIKLYCPWSASISEVHLAVALQAPFLLMHSHRALIWKTVEQNKLDGSLLLLSSICAIGQGTSKS